LNGKLIILILFIKILQFVLLQKIQVIGCDILFKMTRINGI